VNFPFRLLSGPPLCGFFLTSTRARPGPPHGIFSRGVFSESSVQLPTHPLKDFRSVPYFKISRTFSRIFKDLDV